MNGVNFDYIVVGARGRLRRVAIGLLTVLVVIAAPAAAALGGGGVPVALRPAALRIVNDTEVPVLRCQLVLAHFMTRDLPAIAPGEEVEVDLRWEAATGTLFHGAAGARKTAVENLLCGADQDWVATRNDVDLTGLREGSARHLRIVCSGGTGVFCTAVAGDGKN